jgi:hypothetical protein
MRTPSRPTQLTLLAAIGIGIAACAAPSEPVISGACVGVTNIKGINYITETAVSAPDRIYDQGEVLGQVTRNRPCNDTPPALMGLRMWSEDEVPFEPGDSNQFVVGTRICAIRGESPDHLVMLCDRLPSDQRILRAVYIR